MKRYAVLSTTTNTVLFESDTLFEVLSVFNQEKEHHPVAIVKVIAYSEGEPTGPWVNSPY